MSETIIPILKATNVVVIILFIISVIMFIFEHCTKSNSKRSKVNKTKDSE